MDYRETGTLNSGTVLQVAGFHKSVINGALYFMRIPAAIRFATAVVLLSTFVIAKDYSTLIQLLRDPL